MNITQIKIFGERNTGTNWLEDLVIKNYDTPVMHHRKIIKREITESESRFISALPQKQKAFMQERVNDSIFAHKTNELFGWKHASVVCAAMENNPKFRETGFICLVKHPYTFIKSLHKRPYHALIEPPRSVDKFVMTPWPTLHRDNINVSLLRSPIELWNYKVSSYLEFVERYSNAILLRYESLLENYEILFDVLDDEFSLKSKSRLPILRSSKPDKLVTSDYKSKYLDKDPGSGLKRESIDFMRSILDKNLTKVCQYAL